MPNSSRSSFAERSTHSPRSSRSHSRSVPHNEFCPDTCWLRSDLSLALIALWGRIDRGLRAHERQPHGAHGVSHPIRSTAQTDLFDWASLVFERMTGSQPMDQLDGYEGSEFLREVERRVQRNDFPSLEEARNGVIVGRCWKGEHKSALKVMVDAKRFIEERGMRVVSDDVAGLLGFGILLVETEGLDKSEGKEVWLNDHQDKGIFGRVGEKGTKGWREGGMGMAGNF